MKREKRTTKKERKADKALLSPGTRPGFPAGARASTQQQAHDHKHIHCIACGKHLEPASFGEPGGPEFYRCQHGSDFAHCAEHAARAKQLVDEHDRTGKPVQSAPAVH